MEAMTDAPRPKRKYTRRKPLPEKTAKPGTVGEILERTASPDNSAAFNDPRSVSVTDSVTDLAMEQTIERPPLREPVREEDPRAAAMKRAQEWFSHIESLPDGRDKYYIDPSKIPDGWTYEWKRWTTIGREDPQYQVSLQQTAWQAVPASRHPELMPTGFRGQTIDIDGMRLMERPEMITNWQKDRDKQNAEAPIRNLKAKLSAAPQGQFDRSNPGGASPVKINTSFAPPEIPKA
jgi:hypothetical protein